MIIRNVCPAWRTPSADAVSARPVLSAKGIAFWDADDWLIPRTAIRGTRARPTSLARAGTDADAKVPGRRMEKRGLGADILHWENRCTDTGEYLATELATPDCNISETKPGIPVPRELRDGSEGDECYSGASSRTKACIHTSAT